MNYKVANRICPVCSNSKVEILYNQQFVVPEGYHLPVSFDVVYCDHCGFVYSDTTAAQKDYNLYYEALSKYEDESITIGSGGCTRIQDIQRYERITACIKRYINKQQSVIDIGCANGGLLRMLKDSEYENLTGMDLAQRCLDNVNSYGIRTQKGSIVSEDLSEDKALKEQFDCIILSHIMEHICDLKTALKNIFQWLKPNGYVYIEVPDASRYVDFYIAPYHYFDCEHINHFDENSLRNLFGENGFKLVFSERNSIAMSDTARYPVVCMVFRKLTDLQIDKKPLSVNSAMRDNIRQYILKSRKEDSYQVIGRYVQSQEPIVVWGVGSFLQRLLATSKLSECNIIAFVDSDINKQGKKINGVSIIAPAMLKSINAAVLICSVLYTDEILGQIYDMALDIETVVLK